MSNEVTFSTRSIYALILSLAIILVLILIDLIEDVVHGVNLQHMTMEFLPFFVALSGITALSWRLVKASKFSHDKAKRLGMDLADSREDAIRWRAEAQAYTDGLSVRIATQFSCWNLTPAEKEVALLLLKGYSHRDVAQVRGISEATARQQARAVYRKADLTGRHDLAAFFLEDLALPSAA